MPSVFWLNFTLIRISGFWKLNGRYQNIYKIYCVTAWISVSLLCVSQIILLLTSLSNISTFNNAICSFAGVSLSLGKGLLVRRAAGRLENVQKQLDRNLDIASIGTNEDQQILKKSKDIANVVNFGLMVIALLTAVAWAIFPLVDGTRKLPLPIWSPPVISPYYEIMYVTQLVLIFWVALCLGSVGAMFVTFIIQICSQFCILIQHIDDFAQFLGKGDQEEKAVEENLYELIRHHQATMGLVHEIGTVYRGAMLLHIIATAAMIVASGLEVFVLATSINSHVMSRVLFFILGLGDSFVHCFAADAVYRQNGLVTKAVYRLPWETLTKRHQKIIMIMIIRSQKPSVISYGGFGALTLETFVMVTRTAYSIFSLLRQVSQT